MGLGSLVPRFLEGTAHLEMGGTAFVGSGADEAAPSIGTGTLYLRNPRPETRDPKPKAGISAIISVIFVRFMPIKYLKAVSSGHGLSARDTRIMGKMPMPHPNRRSYV
jgi:hypothetical protein